MSFNLLIFVALLYAALLFVVAFIADQRAKLGRARWLGSPAIYTLSLSIYCTAWTFYGAVGNAARNGLEFVTIYLGPTLVMVGWWWFLRKLVWVGRAQRVTSIADLISSRFGKSTPLGVLVTVIAIIAATPYIALQLQSVVQSLAVFADSSGEAWGNSDLNRAALWVSIGLALFTILFGTRNLDANEKHHGIVTAIALEAIVKLCALVAVGVFVVWGMTGGVRDTLALIDASPISEWEQSGGRWAGLIFVSAAAFVCLPRMFQVMVVENEQESHLATASWAFPLYLLAMSLFVLPIAVVGLEVMPEGSNPDLFVLTLPLSASQEGLAVFSFLGGFSSATSMVIVATIALATMVSNHIVVPIWLSSQREGALMSGDVRSVVIGARRFSIVAVLVLGYLYFRTSGGGSALAAIGLVSFTGAIQVLPAIIGALFWRGATRVGASAGLTVGLAIWAWTLFLPSFGPNAIITESVMAAGPFGIEWLRPQALFGIGGQDPLLHAVFWSMSLNALIFVIGSVFSFPTPLERLQGAQFVNVFENTGGARNWTPSAAASEDLLIMSQRLLGATEAQKVFQQAAEKQGKTGYLPDVTPEFIQQLERELAGSVGAATAHAMIGQLLPGASISVEDLMAVADEAAQIMEYSSRLEAKSREQERTARQLRQANEKLTALSVQKDAFLSQISHELRTPMTSIRAFSEILQDENADDAQRIRYAGIIHNETMRLTRLLDDLLDLSFLENGQVVLNKRRISLRKLLNQAISSAGINADGAGLKINRTPQDEDVSLTTDPDRLSQVFINLISNAAKYCGADAPELSIIVRNLGADLQIDFVDNGEGISVENQTMIFEKFSRLTDHRKAGGAGLGLAICREIMQRLDGSVSYLPGQGGAAFRVTVPLSDPE